MLVVVADIMVVAPGPRLQRRDRCGFSPLSGMLMYIQICDESLPSNLNQYKSEFQGGGAAGVRIPHAKCC